MSIIVRRSGHFHMESQKYMYSFLMSVSLPYQTEQKRLFRNIVRFTNKSYKWAFKTCFVQSSQVLRENSKCKRTITN